MSSLAQHVYEIRPRKDKRGVDLISDTLPFGRLWYDEPNAVAMQSRTFLHRRFLDQKITAPHTRQV